jgi:CBS domain-containing protein
MKKSIKKYILSENSKLIEAVNNLEKISDKCLIIVNIKNKLKGTITDGDIRRAILKGIDLNGSIKKVYKGITIEMDIPKSIDHKISFVMCSCESSCPPLKPIANNKYSEINFEEF